MRLAFMIANEDIPPGSRVTGLTGSLEENLSQLKKAGFDFFELMISDPARVDVEKIHFLERKTETAISFLCTGEMAGTMGMALNNPDSSQRERALSGLIDAAKKAKALGVNLNIGRLRGTVWEDGPEKSLERLKGALRVVDEYVSNNLPGISILIEPLKREICPLLNSCHETYEFISSIGLKNFSILLDSDHFDYRSDPGFIGEHIETIKHVHIADTMHEPPGHGKIDFEKFLGLLFEAGYTGDISVEVFCGAEQYETLRDSYRFLCEYSRFWEGLR